MATSGSRDFSVSRLDIVQAALRKVGAYDSQDPLPASEQADAAFALNLLLKEWTARGIDIFVREQVTLFLDPNKAVYYLGRTLNDTPTYEATDDLILMGQSSASKIAAAVASGLVTTINTTLGKGPVWVTATSEQSATGFAVYHGFQNAVVAYRTDDGKWNHSRCTGVTSGASNETITLSGVESNGEAADTAAVGNEVRFAEGRRVPDSLGGGWGMTKRPVEIISALRRDPHNGIDVPVNLIGENEYQRLNLKHQTGPVTNLWYKPLGNQRVGTYQDHGELHVWPTGDDTYTDLVMQCKFHVEDMDTVSDNPQFPIEWANAIIFNLAHDLAPEYGISREERIDLFTIGQGKLTQLLEHNVENANVVITLDQRASGAR